LQARERELERKATSLAGRGQNEPNWPPFPPGLPMPFQPWYYHNIQEEIPLVNQGDTFRMFQLWKCMPYSLAVGWPLTL
jgi:hypothetical protein